MLSFEPEPKATTLWALISEQDPIDLMGPALEKICIAPPKRKIPTQ